MITEQMNPGRTVDWWGEDGSAKGGNERQRRAENPESLKSKGEKARAIASSLGFEATAAFATTHDGSHKREETIGILDWFDGTDFVL